MKNKKDKARTYTIHKSKISQSEKDLTARESLRRNLDDTSYRVDTIDTINGVKFICDTRVTDLLSARDTFKYVEEPMVWISGKPKHERDYSLIKIYLVEKLRGIVVYGNTGVDSRNKLSGYVEHFEVKTTLAEAVRAAFDMTNKGDAVVYSPSCKVDDGYLNYVDRGTEFKKIVKELNRN